MSERNDIILIQPRCGKYDLLILDMPLGLLYISRLLLANGYNVHLVDERVEENACERIERLLSRNPLWIGITAMTGEPVRHALNLARYVKNRSKAPVVWGGIHPTILPEQTLKSENVDYVVRGKGERFALYFTEHLLGRRNIREVPGLTYTDGNEIRHNEEDTEADWVEMPLVNYGLIDVSKYWRVGFGKKIFSIMTSRNCPYKCTFCYNSSLRKLKPWMPDSIEYVKHHIDYILDTYHPNYLSFIDDDFFVNPERARNILEYIEGKASQMEIGFRGARVSELLKLDYDFYNLLERVNTRHINIGVESGSPRILKIIRKGITPEMVIKLNRYLAKRPSIIPLYNFFSGIPQETEEDIRLSTKLILQLVEENHYCQISGYHQYTPYPGNELYKEALRSGFLEPKTLEEWGELRFEDNAKNCPWIDEKRRLLLDTLYSMVYFVDNKYDAYIAKHKFYFKMLLPFVHLYKPIAKARLKHHFTAFPVEILAKDLIYRVLTGSP